MSAIDLSLNVLPGIGLRVAWTSFLQDSTRRKFSIPFHAFVGVVPASHCILFRVSERVAVRLKKQYRIV